MKTLFYEDMKLIGLKISFHFRLKRVNKEDLLNSLIADYDQDTLCISYKAIKNTLSE